SYDNTGHLGSASWRHVAFVERARPLQGQRSGLGNFSWLMMSDVCKHCARAGCLESCPTGALVRTEFGSVYVQPDVCNGCGYCVSACPFGVIDKREDDGRAWKCTLCYDRLKADMIPACAKSCPTESIQFGDLVQLRVRAQKRVEDLHRRGTGEAYLYGVDQPGTEGLNAFFLLVDKPEAYNLPPDPVVPTKKVKRSWASLATAAVAMAALAVAAVTGA
ncbi:MAG: 4Fe-4S dicluster domain-containing protein, partial [Myxococcales bacterium]